MKPLLLLILALPCFGQSSMERRLWALAMVESENNPSATGKANEITEYQVLPSVLAENHITIPPNTSRGWAKNAVAGLLEARTGHFRRIYHRQPTDYETGLLWHCPGAIRHPNAEQRDFAQRFANLCQKPLANP